MIFDGDDITVDQPNYLSVHNLIFGKSYLVKNQNNLMSFTDVNVNNDLGKIKYMAFADDLVMENRKISR